MDEPDAYDDYDDYDPMDDEPGPDEAENRLHFDELHPLVQQAARHAWDERDYHEAVIAAWTSLRNRLRERLGSNGDGIELIEEIYGAGRARSDPPRLLLTDYDSQTTQGMHHGLVFLLRGIVLYVRNPEQHENSVVSEDKVAAFERLSLLSLCARHVDVRTEPITIDDALDELRQERFADTAEARAELIQAVPAADHVTFGRQLIAAVQEATDGNDPAMESRCRTVHRQLSRLVAERNRQPVLAQIARDVDRLVSRDQTLDLAIRFVTGPVFERLAARNQRKVAERILEDVGEGTRTRGPRSGVFHRDAARIFPALTVADRQEFLRQVDSALSSDDPQRRTYGVWMAIWISRSLRSQEASQLARSVAATIAAGHAEVVAELGRRMRGVASYEFRLSLRDELARVAPMAPEAEAHLGDARNLVAPPDLRVKRPRR